MLTKPEDRRIQRSRISMLAVIVLIAFFVLIARLWYLQIALGGELLKQSEANWNKLLRTRAPRGSILDCKGRILATSRPQFVVLAVPEELRSDKEALHTLCGILAITPADVEFAAKHAQARPGSPVRLAIDVPLDVVTQIGELRMRLPGVSVELDQIRFYPDGPAVAHIMGYVRQIDQDELEEAQRRGEDYRPGDYYGKAGLEKQYQSLLRGRDGGKRIKVNASNHVVRILGEKPSVPGKTLKLTIDRDLQIAADRAMGSQVGGVVALDPKTGAVLAMVSRPGYDPNVFLKRVSRADWNAIMNNRKDPLHNRCTGSAYPPGSTFKPMMAVAGVTFGACDAHTTVHCGGSIHLGRWRFGDWKTHGTVDFKRALAQSCDVWFYKLSRRLKIERMARVAKSFGIGSKTGIDLPSETTGLMPDPEWQQRVRHESWQPGETLITAIGQGAVAATPLQMAVATAGIADYGKIRRPYLVQEVDDPAGKVVWKARASDLTQADGTAIAFSLVHQGMREAVVAGTGRVCNVEGVAVAGKTGSAEARGAAHGWFVCFAPVENPRIAIACIVEHGRHGATTAAPVCRAILDVFFGKKKLSEIGQNRAQVSGD